MKNIHKCNTAFACALFIFGHMFFLAGARGQGTLLVTFDGPPLQPPGTAYTVQTYYLVSGIDYTLGQKEGCYEDSVPMDAG
jgi:hypothetical protein